MKNLIAAMRRAVMGRDPFEGLDIVEYRFEPKPDITAAELAQIVKGMRPTWFAADGDIEAEPRVARHFVKLGKHTGA